MAKINSLRDIIQFNSNFKTAINLYLSLNKAEKVLGYIPTKSSVSFLGEYLKAVLENKEQATLLVGPYGKGKSHLLLVLLAVLSMKKTPESESAINELIDNVSKTDEVGERVSEYIGQVWDKKRFLPVLITDTTGDLNQAFLYGLNDALKRDGLLDLAPETYYSIALDRIDDWEQNYFETYKMFERELTQNGMSIAELKTDLKQYSQKTLILFKEIYPKVTAGSEFNPMALADALPLYKSVSEKLVDEYGYSGIYIVFDEFSKFIEGQNNIAAGTNMHLLQSMCELATDSKNAQVFITMVAHKSIKEYGKYLSRDLINLFTGIEGRIIEKYFVTSSKNNYELIKNAIVKDDSKLLNIPHYEKYLGKEKFKEFYSLPAFRSGFDETEFKNVIFNGCYPLNPIAAYLLLNISEKVAQNERTLFTFISNDEPHSMARFVSEHTLDKEWSIGADLIYEYFSALFKKDVVNEFIHNIWLSAEYAIDKCDTEDQRKIVKALAVILIVNKEDEIPATEKYLKLCINASDPEQALMIRLIAYIFTNDKWYGSEKVHDIIEAWYWAAIFSGEYDKDQNERFEKNLRSILETLTTKAKKYDWIITLKNNIFETPYFSDCSFLLMEKANEDRIPKEHLAKYICQFYLSRTYSDLIHDDRQINVFSKYKLEKHHIVPVGSVSKIGESTDILRKDKTNIVNSPLNYVFISDATNLEISNISLKEYEQDITASAKAALNIVNYPSVEKLNDKTTIKAWLKERYKILKGQIQNRVMNMLLS